MIDKFRIMIATDNHLGYMENDPIRKEDSFNSFEEILRIAQEKQVDFILLGGDLFHDNKPSTKTMHNCMTLLRQYCMGNRPCEMEFLSDQSENFPNRFATVNYQDPNYNVSIPVFSIHGNHDDPSGDGNLCSLDLLSAVGLVNYFGKQCEVDNIAIKPILLRKGKSKLALYGLGNIRDERLHRTFESKNVTMFRPTEDTDEWFNLLVLHQNRIAHRAKSYIPEHFLDDFLHLVLWGHEHECKLEPHQTPNDGYFITQPGSSVATSLCEGESVEKFVGILHIDSITCLILETEFQLEKIRLKTVRPFVIDEIVLSEVRGLDKDDKTAVNAILQKKVATMITEAKEKWLSSNPKKTLSDIPKPLIRLKVDYSEGFTSFSPHQFARDFADQIANPKDLILFSRKRTVTRKKKIVQPEQDMMELEEMFDDNAEEALVEGLIAHNLSAHKLSIFPELELSDVVSTFVVKQEKDAIMKYFYDTLEKTKNAITLNDDLDDDKRLENIIKGVKEARSREYEATQGERLVQAVTQLTIDPDEYEVEVDVSKFGVEPRNGFDSGRVLMKKKERTTIRKSTTNTTSNRARKTATRKNNSEDEIEEEEEEVEVARPIRSRAPPAITRTRKTKIPENIEPAELSDDRISDGDEPEIIDMPIQKPSTKPTSSRSAAVRQKTSNSTSSRNWQQDEPDNGTIDIELMEPLTSSTIPKKRKQLPSAFSQGKLKQKTLLDTLSTSAGTRKPRQSRF